MVEAAGVEPASENIPLQFLRTYPYDLHSLLKTPKGRIDQGLSLLYFAFLPSGAGDQLSCLIDALFGPAGKTGRTLAV